MLLFFYWNNMNDVQINMIFGNNLGCNRFRERGWCCHWFGFFSFTLCDTVVSEPTMDSVRIRCICLVCCICKYVTVTRWVCVCVWTQLWQPQQKLSTHTLEFAINSEHARIMHRWESGKEWFTYKNFFFSCLVHGNNSIDYDLWYVPESAAKCYRIRNLCRGWQRKTENRKNRKNRKIDHKKWYLCSFNAAMCVCVCVCVYVAMFMSCVYI